MTPTAIRVLDRDDRRMQQSLHDEFRHRAAKHADEPPRSRESA